MAGSPHFSAPHEETDSATFKPTTNLPAHLEQYQKISAELRHKMTPVMQAVLALTDKASLRPAAIPQAD